MGTLKKSLLLVLMLIVGINTIFAQSEQNSQNNQDQAFVETVPEADDYFSQADTNTENFKSANSTGVYVRMIIFLILIVAAIYGVMWFFKKKSNPQADDDTFLRRVSSVPLGPGKSVDIVTLVDKAYVVGVTDGSINLISEIEDKELIEALNLNYDKTKNVKKPMNFSDVLDMFMPNGPREKNIYADAEKKVKNLSRRK